MYFLLKLREYYVINLLTFVALNVKEKHLNLKATYALNGRNLSRTNKKKKYNENKLIHRKRQDQYCHKCFVLNLLICVDIISPLGYFILVLARYCSLGSSIGWVALFLLNLFTFSRESQKVLYYHAALCANIRNAFCLVQNFHQRIKL